MISSEALYILVETAVICAAYAAALQCIHHIYAPDWIWLTVVGGNGIILWSLWRAADAAIVPLSAWWFTVYLNIAAGIPIICWQIGQSGWRKLARRARKDHGETATD